MRKISMALAVFAALTSAVSCRIEIETSGTPSGPMTINAVSEGMGVASKVEMAYRYDLLWQANDQIYVTDGRVNDTFTLSEGAGTTRGTFIQDGGACFSGEVEAYYPKTLVSGGSPVWPAVQTAGQTVPMYSSKTVSGNEEDFTFTSLGAMLQIVFNSTVDGVVLKSVVIRDGRKNMSGPFTVDENGMAEITATDKAGITLDFGAGKALGRGANYINLAVPAGKYNDVTISFITTDMHVCTMHSSTLPEIMHNSVCRITLTGTRFGDNTLPGEFSVGNGRVVSFSKGNLYWDGDSFEFEDNQYDYPTSRESTHIGHFFWSNDPQVALAESYNDPDRGEHDVFFTNAAEETPAPGFTACGITGRFRTLSMLEWKYLLDERSNAARLHNPHVSVCGKGECLIIAPDNYSADIKSSYSAEEWPAAEAAGLVCLPPAGYVYMAGSPVSSGFGYYWSSAPWTSSGAQYIAFSSVISGVVKSGSANTRDECRTVRLVRDKEFVTGVSLNRTSLDLSLMQSVKLVANVLPADAPLKNVSWTSDNPDVATVAADGTVFGVAAGTATITAVSENAFKTASCTVTVLPQYAGEFSVSSGKKVRFSKGNLYWDGDSFEFETNQYDYPTTRAATHLGHFFWSSNPEVARASSYKDPDCGEHDVFFTNAAEDTAASGFTVCGITGRFRTLSLTEWRYLLDGRNNAAQLHKLHVTVCGKEHCLILAPDGFSGTVGNSYNAEEWQAAEASGLICLPAAGYSLIENDPSGNAGYYWSSAPWETGGAQFIAFSKGTEGVAYDGRSYTRSYCCTARLVSDVTAE